jgi:choloylglycine hydrolase
VLAGRNWDMIEDGTRPVMWFVPASKGAHGRVCFGRHNGCEDGMNDQGLFVAVAATPASGRFEPGVRPMWCPVALDLLLATCATVDEAVAWWEQHNNPAINSTIFRKHALLGISFGHYVNSGVGGHILISDRSGNSVVCEWIKGKLTVIRKTARYQLVTNFLLSKPDLGGSPCPRFAVATRILDEAGRPSLATCTETLNATCTELTRYSVVYDLVRGHLCVYCRGHFENGKRIHLSEELRKGPHEVNLYVWFGVQR